MIGWIEKTFPLLQMAVAMCGALWVALAAAWYLRYAKASTIAGLYRWSSVVTGLYCWELALIITYRTLGTYWMVVGLLAAAVGVIPMAFIGAAVREQWSEVPQLGLALLLVMAPRIVAAWLATRDLSTGIKKARA